MESLDQVPEGATVVLPPHGFVHLQACSASDLDVVNAARVSFAKQSAWQGMIDGEGVLLENDRRVLEYLLSNRHGTPFEHTYFKFHVRAPIFVFREWHRHRIGVSINEESARYSPLTGDFWYPEGDAVRGQAGKPGRYTFDVLPEDQHASIRNEMRFVYDQCYAAYESLMAAGVAKEIARAVLPVGIYSQMVWSANARSLMSFFALRSAPTAMREIRVYSLAMEEIFAKHMPVTYQAFLDNDRTAP